MPVLPPPYKSTSLALCVALLVPALHGCGSQGDDKPAGSSTAAGASGKPTAAAATVTATATATATAAAPAAAGEFKARFPRTGIKPLEGCTQDAYVMVSTGDGDVPKITEALLHPISGIKHAAFKPEAGILDVRFFRKAKDEGPVTLVGRCGTPETCNEVAAYLSHARVFPKPQLFCGKPTLFGTFDKDAGWVGTWHVLEKTDIQTTCARLAACRYDADPTLPPNLYNDCAKSPSVAKSECGEWQTCKNVLACFAKK